MRLKSKMVAAAIVGILILLGVVYAGWTDYEDLDCEVRFNLEGWYMDRHPGEPMENATFTEAQLQNLTLPQACGVED